MKTASRSVVLVLLSLMALVLAASPAMAGPVIDRATAALKTDPVYVDPAATDLLKEDQASQLRSKIQAGSAPIVVAVLPADAVTEAGDVNKVVSTLGKALKDQGQNTTVAVLVKNPQGGTSFRAGSGVLPEGKATELADQAAAANKSNGPAAALSDFVAKVQSQSTAKAPAGNSSGGGAPGARTAPTTAASLPATSSSSSGFGKLILFFLVGLLCLVVPIALIVMLVRRAGRSSGGGGGMAPAGSDYLPAGPINRSGGGYNPTPGYGGGGRSFGSGVAAGAVGGGLLGAAGGYMLGEHMGREHERDDMQNEQGGGDSGGYEQQQPNDGNWDNEGVGGGDWGGDSGGGGGDWGGGDGGGDWGGGGGDFGGGTDF